MQRLSASGIAGLFENFPNPPRKKTKPGEFLLNTVFPRGHVREHDCIHYLARCQGIKDMRGQNGYARGFEYLEGDLLRIYSNGLWLIKENRTLFDKLFIKELEKKILNATGAHIAFKERSILLLLEEEIGEHFLHEFSRLLSSVIDISTENVFKSDVIQPALKIAHSIFFSPVGHKNEEGYMVKDIPYTLPRYRANYGCIRMLSKNITSVHKTDEGWSISTSQMLPQVPVGVFITQGYSKGKVLRCGSSNTIEISTQSSVVFNSLIDIIIGGVDVVCQPDGYCIANGKTAVVEIKSPMYGHYTSQATVANPKIKGKGTAKTATDRRKLWVKYLIQIAIEMDVTRSEEAIFLSWYDHSGKIILLTREIMSPLIAAIKEFVGDLSLLKQGSLTDSVATALKKITGDTPISHTSSKSSKVLTIEKLKEKLIAIGFTDFNFGKNKPSHKRQPYIDKLAELNASNNSSSDSNSSIPNSYEKVKQVLHSIMHKLTVSGEAWTPLEDIFSISGLDVVAASLKQLSVEDKYIEPISDDMDGAHFRTYVKY